VIQLRPQQIVFEDAIRDAFRRVRTVLAVAPTGFGKGVCLADMGFKAAAKGKRVLIVTNRRVIVLQLQEQCYKAGIRSGVIMGTIERDDEAPVQIASIQTMRRRQFWGTTRPGFLMLDEAHREFSEYQKLICERFSDVPTVGFTASPVGPGGERLSSFEEIVEPIKNSEVIAAGDLLPVHPYLAPNEPDMTGIDLKHASQDEIGTRVHACTVYGDVFKEWEPYSHMQTMVILPSRAVCNAFLQMCLARGLTARIVDGTTGQDERDQTFSEFKERDCQMLLGVDVIREGLDLPIAQCLIDLQPTHQFRVYWQKIGRVKRPHPGQNSAVVIDFAGNLWRHMVHPDQDPPWQEITHDTTIEAVIERKAGLRCPKCGSKYIYSIKGAGYKCEDCKHEWQTRKPWVCPRCSQALAPWQKAIGGVCPNCGEKVATKPIRRIRMADGSLRTVPVDEIKRRKKCRADSELAAWLKWVYVANGWNRKPENAAKKKKTLAWCKVMFCRTEGHWPRVGMKYMPENRSDWKRTPAAVFPWLAKPYLDKEMRDGCEHEAREAESRA